MELLIFLDEIHFLLFKILQSYGTQVCKHLILSISISPIYIYMSILRVPTFFTFFLCLNFVSQAQVLREGTKHAQLLCRDDQDYIGQPLSKVLEKISPFIKAVSVEGGWFEAAPNYVFLYAF